MASAEEWDYSNMNKYPKALENLIDCYAKLPSVGKKTAERYALYTLFSMDDADSMMRNWVSDDNIQGMYGEPSYKTKEAVEALINKFIKRCQGGYSYRWAIVEKTSGECIGQVAYFLVDSHGAFGEIEYCIGSVFQGKGYATEATKAVIDCGFRRIGFNKVQICVRPANTPSKSVIEKCGFTYEGALRDYFMINDKYEDRLYYSILKDEWK